MRGVLLGSAILFLCAAQGQELRIEAGTDDPQLLHFDPAFIARNRIACIRGEGLVKRDNQPMRDKNERTVDQFDDAGRAITFSTFTTRSGNKPDTSTVTYRCDAQGRVLEELRHDLVGAYLLRDSLDSVGRPVRRTYVRITESDADPTRTIISDERFGYAPINDTAWRKTWYNDRGLPYREQTFHKDAFGYLREVNDHYLITGRRGRITFRYSEKGRLFERVEQADLSTPSTHRMVWKYDNAGNVTTCDQWRDDRAVKHGEYLYEEDTMLLKAVIAREEDTGLIHVTRYTTERR